MRNLERRYRLLMKVLPRWYRQDREEEMVGLFLSCRTVDGWPGWGETAAMLGLAVRTHLAAAGAPARTVWRGEVVRAVGMLGLLLGIFQGAPWFTHLAYAFVDGRMPPPLSWATVVELGPLVAFVFLLCAWRTWAKVAAGVGAAGVFAMIASPNPLYVGMLVDLPVLVTVVCLCLGYHRDAPMPPARRLAWWGGGAFVLGLGGSVLWGLGLAMVALAVLTVRVVAFVRGDVVLGRALSLFALLLLAPLSLSFLGGGVHLGLAVAALLVVSAAAPVRRVSVPGFRRP